MLLWDKLNASNQWHKEYSGGSRKSQISFLNVGQLMVYDLMPISYSLHVFARIHVL